MTAAATRRCSIKRIERELLLARRNLRRLQQKQRLHRNGQHHRTVLTILLHHPDSRRLIAMRTNYVSLRCMQITGMQLGHFVKMHPPTLTNPKCMGVQQGRKALQQCQQND